MCQHKMKEQFKASVHFLSIILQSISYFEILSIHERKIKSLYRFLLLEK